MARGKSGEMGIMEKRVRELIESGVAMDPIMLGRAYKSRFDTRIDRPNVERFMERYQAEKRRDDSSRILDMSALDVVKEKSGSDFVPDRLMEAIPNISRAVKTAGGFDNAIEITQAITDAGGVDNFIRGVELLRTITASQGNITLTPAVRPQFAGS